MLTGNQENLKFNFISVPRTPSLTYSSLEDDSIVTPSGVDCTVVSTRDGKTPGISSVNWQVSPEKQYSFSGLILRLLQDTAKIEFIEIAKNISNPKYCFVRFLFVCFSIGFAHFL